MSDEPTEETSEPAEPPTDEYWQKLRETIKAGMEMGITEVQELKELIDATRNEDLRATANLLVQKATEMTTKQQQYIEILVELVGGRGRIAGAQLETEMAFYKRLGEMVKAVQSPEDLFTLASTYVELRSASVAPGWYDPDTRHSD
jgi:predicted P-loop ATPase